ncbi:MAG TPA: glycosyltransferase family 39 protein [Bryobacteraceae bacterium]|nr:glycosyltransferase family 39 protein [Bryobacteraceae bacterium]
MSLSAILCLLTFSGYSRPKTPWMDEVLQTTIERLPTGSAVWDALRDGGIQVDPPLLHLSVHYLFRAFGESIYLARLPSILGFCLMCVAVACLVRRYASPIYAASAFFLPYATVLRSRGIDARPYGLMFGFSALVLLCWDGIDRSPRKTWWRIAFTFSMALMLSTHFYSILLLLPLAMGEVAKSYFRKRADWATLACVAVAMIPYVVWLPTLLSAARRYASHYYYPAKFSNLYDFYGSAIASLPMAGVLLFLLAVVAIIGYTAPLEALSEGARRFQFVSVGFLLVPVVGYLAGVTITGLFVPYYHYIATFGVILGLPLILSSLSGGNRVVGLCLLLAIGGHGLFVSARGISGFVRSVHREYPLAAEFRRLTGEERPDIVIPAPAHFLPLREENRDDAADSFVYLFDSKKALQALGTDTADLLYERLRRITPARIESFDPYVASHARFYIAVLGPIKGIQEWQYDYLLKQMHARLWWLGKAGDFDVFRVEIESAATPH